MALSKKKTNSEEGNWISFSDIMTGLMVIFMFIAVSYMLEVQKKQKQRDDLFEEFQATKESIYLSLDSAFREDFLRWKVELDKDLSIKFTNPEVLFESGQTNIRPEFQEILNNFLPRYFEIILQDKYKEKIYPLRLHAEWFSPKKHAQEIYSFWGNLYTYKPPCMYTRQVLIRGLTYP
jgi:flagellar motor protein MotB